MCGIVGYIGDSEAAPILIEGLRRLEYRGYDSAGIAVCGDDIQVVKEKGRIDNLQMRVDEENPQGTIGIGHTRWATHGVPDKTNAHPHKSMNGVVTLVHNGIIENYIELKNELIANGYEFKSETDTEVIAQLFDYLYDGNVIGTMIKCANLLEGSYAVAMLVNGRDNKVYAMKKDSPMIVGKGENQNYLASDIPAILPYTRECYIVNDGEFIEIGRNDIKVFDKNGEEKVTEIKTIDMSIDAAEKGGYDYFMAKEIYEQPKALRDTLSPRLKNGEVVLDGIDLSAEYLKDVRKIYLVACGSAYYVSVLAKYIIEKACRIPTEAVMASEFRYADPVVDEHNLVIIISQSGETADTLAALREAKRLGAKTLAVVNVVGSAIAKTADQTIYTWAGPEIAVATTKAFSTQLAVVYLLAAYMAKQLGTMDDATYRAWVEALEELPAAAEKVLSEENVQKVQYYASRYYGHHDAFYIGRNVDSAICLEGSLKLKEVAYLHSEAYPAGELKHGPISLIENGTLVVALATVQPLFDKTMANVREVKARGADVLCVTLQETAEEAAKQADGILTVPTILPVLQPSLTLIPLQLFSYYVALNRGCDVDKPRNLAKSVTVE